MGNKDGKSPMSENKRDEEVGRGKPPVTTGPRKAVQEPALAAPGGRDNRDLWAKIGRGTGRGSRADDPSLWPQEQAQETLAITEA
jgi:hypothetical protein